MINDCEESRQLQAQPLLAGTLLFCIYHKKLVESTVHYEAVFNIITLIDLLPMGLCRMWGGRSYPLSDGEKCKASFVQWMCVSV